MDRPKLLNGATPIDEAPRSVASADDGVQLVLIGCVVGECAVGGLEASDRDRLLVQDRLALIADDSPGDAGADTVANDSDLVSWDEAEAAVGNERTEGIPADDAAAVAAAQVWQPD